MDDAINDPVQLRRPAGVPFHWLYFILYGIAMTAALWKHGHPIFTLVILGSVLPAACIIYIPFRILGKETRSWLQVSVVCLGIFWAIFRLSQRVPVDKMLIETICLMGMSFAFTSRPSDYGYQFLISILLLVYGALLPRAMYIFILPAAFIIGLLVLYRSRIKSLAGESEAQIPKGVFRRNWRYLVFHAMLAVVLWIYIYSVLPTEPRQSKGIIAVSFRNENESYIAPEFNAWVKTRQVKPSNAGNLNIPGFRPSYSSRSGPRVSSGGKAEEMSSSGEGAGTPGEEIVFRVKSPVKLYWLGQLYDVYDGNKWKLSKWLKKQKTPWKSDMWKHLKRIEQRVIIEKWISPVLYAAFRASYYNLGFTFREKTERTYCNERLAAGAVYPDTPFTYSVSSEIVFLDSLKGEKNVNLWFERIKPKHYLALPRRKISKRLVTLAKKITQRASGDYEKAIALRDYLRNNFKYQMYSHKTPPKREAVDYFIFDLKEGHCEYFASSLAVLARLNGLPARVATGFSPGNYNALNGYFEVHEYHAHAWTQIFIKGKGWLTFDATPPGQIVSRTTPLGLGSLHDPFGDEWKVTPPEMTEATQKAVRPEPQSEDAQQVAQGMDKKKIKDIKPPLFTRMFISVAMAPEQIGNSIDKIKERMFPNAKKGMKFKDMFAAIRINLTAVLKKFVSGWKDFAGWLMTPSGVAFLLFIVCIGVFVYFSPLIFRLIDKRIRLKKCEAWFVAAKKSVSKNPRKSIALCYRMTRELLDIAGWPRIKNMELFDYGATLKNVDTALCKDTLVIYFIYTKIVYSEEDAVEDDSKTVFKKAASVRKFLLQSLKRK